MMMMLEELRALCLQAMQDEPHIERVKTLENLRYLSYVERAQAVACYAAVIGERTLPNDHQKHAQPVLKAPLKGRARAVREAQARRILEERKDMT